MTTYKKEIDGIDVFLDFGVNQCTVRVGYFKENTEHINMEEINRIINKLVKYYKIKCKEKINLIQNINANGWIEYKEQPTLISDTLSSEQRLMKMSI